MKNWAELCPMMNKTWKNMCFFKMTMYPIMRRGRGQTLLWFWLCSPKVQTLLSRFCLTHFYLLPRLLTKCLRVLFSLSVRIASRNLTSLLIRLISTTRWKIRYQLLLKGINRITFGSLSSKVSFFRDLVQFFKTTTRFVHAPSFWLGT